MKNFRMWLCSIRGVPPNKCTNYHHHPGPEVEARINAFRETNGPVLFGGQLASNVDRTLAVPDSLGLYLDEPSQTGSNTNRTETR